MPPQPTLTDDLTPRNVAGNSGEAERIDYDLLQIKGIIERNPDSRWAIIYARWIRDGIFVMSDFKERHGKSIEEWHAAD